MSDLLFIEGNTEEPEGKVSEEFMGTSPLPETLEGCFKHFKWTIG